jgi:hypothetical protein
MPNIQGVSTAIKSSPNRSPHIREHGDEIFLQEPLLLKIEIILPLARILSCVQENGAMV